MNVSSGIVAVFTTSPVLEYSTTSGFPFVFAPTTIVLFTVSDTASAVISTPSCAISLAHSYSPLLPNLTTKPLLYAVVFVSPVSTSPTVKVVPVKDPAAT